MGGVGLFFVVILLALVVKQNQPLLRTSTMTVTPFRVDFYNQHRELAMTKYFRGGASKRRYGYASGTLQISDQLKGRQTKVTYIDSRAKEKMVVNSKPQLTFYYESRRGKFNDYGRCRVAGHPEIKTFRMTKLDSGN